MEIYNQKFIQHESVKLKNYATKAYMLYVSDPLKME